MSTIVVDQSNGVDTDFTNITDAVAAAQNGDTILIRPGDYSGQLINIADNRSLTFQGSTGHPEDVIIDRISTLGSLKVDGVHVNATQVGAGFVNGGTWEAIGVGSAGTDLVVTNSILSIDAHGAADAQQGIGLNITYNTHSVDIENVKIGPFEGGFQDPGTTNYGVWLNGSADPGNAVKIVDTTFATDTPRAVGIAFDGQVGGDQINIENNYFEDPGTAPGSIRIFDFNDVLDGSQDYSGINHNTFTAGKPFSNETALDNAGGTDPVTFGATNAVMGTDGNDHIFAVAGNDAVDGGLGNDTYDLANAGTGGATADLNTGISFSTDTGIDTLTNIENLKGSAGSDLLYGDDNSNTFFATGGADVIDGRGGADTYDMSSASTAATVDLVSGNVSGGGFGTAKLTGIENVKTGSGDDTITLSSADNAVDGGAGVDTVNVNADKADATITWNAATQSFSVATATQGTDTLTNVEVAHFNDHDVWLVHDSAELTNALAHAAAGSTIKLADGTYSGHFTINTDGLTIESANGDASKVVLQGSFKTDNGIGSGQTVGDFVKTHSYTGGQVGVSVAADNVTISNITISQYDTGIDLKSNDGLTLNNLVLDQNITGVYKITPGADVTDFTMNGGTISNGYIGIYSTSNFDGTHMIGSFDGVVVDGTTFEHMTQKGMYFEQLSHAELTDLIMNDVGEYGGGTAFGAAGANGAGIDINLKYGDFSHITISDFTFTDVGSSDGLGLPQVNGSAISIKARDDGSDYGRSPAHLDGVTIENGSIDGTSTGIRFGEPGKVTGGATGVVVSHVDIHDALVASYDNQTTTIRNIVLSDGDDTATVNPAATGAFAFTGGKGDDHISGGVATDHAVYTSAIDVHDISVDTLTNTWTVKTGTSEGTDQLKDIEVVDSGTGGHVLLVGAGGFDTIQAAVNAAQDGDTIMIAAGNYNENVNIADKELTIVGAQEGITGAEHGADESVIHGRITVSGHEDVTLDGLTILADGSTGTSGPSSPALKFSGDGDFVVKNTVFDSEFNGGASGTDARAISLDTSVTGNVTIENNYFTGAGTNYSGAAWGRGVWSDGSESNLTISGNEFNHVRSSINLDGYNDATHHVFDNIFAQAGSGISIGIPVTTTFTGIHDNDFQTVEALNFQNVTDPITIDLTGTRNHSTTGDPIIVYGGTKGDHITGSAGADIIAGNGGADVISGGGGADKIDGGAGTDTATYAAGSTIAIDNDGHWTVTTNGVTDTLTNVEKVTIGDKTYVLVDQKSDGGFHSVQDAIDAAGEGDTILIAPGSAAYTEHANYNPADGSNSGSNPVGLLINKDGITLQGVDTHGAAITNENADLPTILSGVQSNWGTNFYVTGSNVSIVGLNLEGVPAPGDTEINKVIEVVANGFTLQHSAVGAQDGIDVASTIYINDAVVLNDITGFVSQISSYLIDHNILEGGFVTTNGPGTGIDPSQWSFVVSDNQFVDNYGSTPGYNTGIYVNGHEAGIPWRLAPAGLPTATGNTFAADYSLIFRVLDDDLHNLPDRAYMDAFTSKNGITDYAYLADSSGDPKSVAVHTDNPYGAGDVNSHIFYVHQSLSDAMADANAGDHIVVKTSSDETATVSTEDLTIELVSGSGQLDVTLAAGIDKFHLAGSEDVNVNGNGIANHIYGNGGDNSILGGGGDDVIASGGGSDILVGGAGMDTAVFDKSFADYTITRQGSTYIFDDGTNSTVVTGVEKFTIGGVTVDVSQPGHADDIVTSAGPTITGVAEAGTDEDSNPLTIAVDENSAVGTQVATVSATDPNQAFGDTLTYSLVTNLSGNTPVATGAAFAIDAATGLITVAGSLDHEATPTQNLFVKVTDATGHSVVSEISVTIGDVNEAPTAPSLDHTSVFEASDGEVVGVLSAVDPDGDDLTYSVVNDNRFTVVTEAGQHLLKLKDGVALDYETEKSVSLTVKVDDGEGHQVSKTFNIDVTNVNEAPFGLKLDGGSTGSVDEDVDGAVVGTLTAQDPDDDAVSFTVVGAAASRFEAVNQGTAQDPAWVLKLRDDVSIDFETEPTATIQVGITGSDGQLSSDVQTFTINVINHDDTPGGETLQSAGPIEQGSTRAALNFTPLESKNGDVLIYTVNALPSDGTIFLNGKAITADQDLTAAQLQKLTYSVPDDSLGTTLQLTAHGDHTVETALTLNIDVSAAVSGTYKGTAADDRLDSAAGNDTVLGRAGNDTLLGASGNDVLDGGKGADDLRGGTGSDTADYGDASKAVTVSLAKPGINTGDAKGDTFGSIENLTGSQHNDALTGDEGANVIRGAAGADHLTGGDGGDSLYGGGGHDTFVFLHLSDSTVKAGGQDTIFDFGSGDDFDLSAIDANSERKGNQAFSFIQTNDFDGKAGELRYEKSGSDTFVYVDTNGDKHADFAFHLDDAVKLVKHDFTL